MTQLRGEDRAKVPGPEGPNDAKRETSLPQRPQQLLVSNEPSSSSMRPAWPVISAFRLS